jgi:F-type H+-transporting ATPase subunit b
MTSATSPNAAAQAAAPVTNPAAPVTQSGTAAPGGHPAGGLPQFDLSWWPGQMVWFLIIFGVVFILMAKVFVPRIGGAIGTREDKIAGDIGDARRLKAEAEAQAAAAAAETAQARAQAQKVASDAKARANAEAAASRAAEDAKLAESLATAELSIKAARDQSMSNVRAIASDTASAIIDKLTGEAATTKEVEAAFSGRA